MIKIIFAINVMSVLCCYNVEGERAGDATRYLHGTFQESGYPLGLSRGLLPDVMGVEGGGGLGEGVQPAS